MRTDETLPAGTFDLDIATTVQDLAGSTPASAYGQQFEVVNVGADLELFEAPDERIIPTSSVGNVHGFQGLPMDAETGLIYVRNRYYDPELGRFITPDPLGYVDGPSMYSAFLNDPANRADPLGLCVMYLPCPEIIEDTVQGVHADLGRMGLGLIDLVSGGSLSGSYAGAQAYARQPGTTGERVRAGIEAYVTQRDSVRTLGYSTAEDPWQHTEDLLGIQAVQDAGTLLGTAVAEGDLEMALEGTGRLLEGSGQISSTVLVFYAPVEAAVARSRVGVGVFRGSKGAENAINARLLAQQLTRQEASSVFTRGGTLHSEVIAESRLLIRGNNLRNQAVIRELTADGSSIADWAKYGTRTYRGPSGAF